jgi:molecular chaperone HscA
MPAGIARVEITYAVDADGILRVSARELTTGIEQGIQVKPTYGLTEEEVEKMLVESIEHAEEDVTERFVREWRVEGDRILASLETAFALDGELLKPDERETIEDRMRGLREAMAGTDYLAVKAWLASLDAASKAFAERRMDKHIVQAMAGHRVEEFAEMIAADPRATGAPGGHDADGEG